MSEAITPPRLSSVTVHGATLAGLLQSVTSGGAPCDGLLFGETTHTTKERLQDSDEAVLDTTWQAVITSVMCCATSCSFYDAAGELGPQLDALCDSQPERLLGWVSYRPASALRCSMREAAVTQALLAQQLQRSAGRQALLLLLVTTGTDHNSATVTWQYRCLQARLTSPGLAGGDLVLEPVELSTLNLAHHTGQRDYEELLPTLVSPASRAMLALLEAGRGAGVAPPPSLAQGAELRALAAGANAQAGAMRQYCEGLLGGLRELCDQAVAGEAAVEEMRQRRDALLARQAAGRGRLG